MDRRRATLVILSAALMPVLALLAGCRDEPTVVGSASPPTSDATSSTAENDVPGTPPRIDALGDGALEPGWYALPPLGPGHHPVAVVDVPAGYTHWGPFLNATEPRSRRIR